MSGIFEKHYSDMRKVVEDMDFHDSIVTGIKYDPESYTTVISLEFCNRKQPDYKGDEPEMLRLYLECEYSFLLGDPEKEFSENQGKILEIEAVDSRTLKFDIDPKDPDRPQTQFTVISDRIHTRENEPFLKYVDKMAESEHYTVLKEFETCILLFKDRSRRAVSIGDFYGDADFALIDKNEMFVVTGGCGIVIYRLQEPFERFRKGKKTEQWIEIGMDKEEYYDSVTQIGDNAVRIIDEDGNEKVFEII